MATLTLNGETREVIVNHITTYANGNKLLIIPGIKMRTRTGNKVHVGTLYTNKELDHYTLADINDIHYHGMRGNGHGAKSTFAWIGF